MTISNTKYAVDLSDEGVSLWRRDKEKTWKFLGKASLSSPSFSDDVEKLKIGQAPNDGSKFVAQVRIPRSEVFVSSIDLGGIKGAAATSKIKKFLGDKTPYKATELAYDIETEKGTNKTFVAAITKKTLSEAKDFISGYGFEALYYTTKIDKAEFPKKPRFYDGDKPVVTAAAVGDTAKETTEKSMPEDTAKPVEIDVPPPPKATPAKAGAKIQPLAPDGADQIDTSNPKNVESPAEDDVPQIVPGQEDSINFATVRSKSLTAPNKMGGKIEPTIAKAPPSPLPRISIEIPNPGVDEQIKPISATPPPASATPNPLKMPQGETLQTDVGGFFKPRYILALLAIALIALFYWLYTALFDGKEEIARLQQTPVIDETSVPVIMAQPDALEQSTSEDTALILLRAVELQSNLTPSLATPLSVIGPEPAIVVEDAATSAVPLIPDATTALATADDVEAPSVDQNQLVSQGQVTSASSQVAAPDQTTVQTEEAATEPAQEQSTEIASLQPLESAAELAPQADIKPAETKPEAVAGALAPTTEGTPSAEGITLFASQPDIVPPRREQLELSTDPLKNILPQMRSAAFEETHKSKTAIVPETVVTAETTTHPDPNEAEGAVRTDAPDLLALADPSLKSSLPKPRPSSVEQKAQEAKISLLTKADPSLANLKPKLRSANLAVPIVETNPTKVDPSEIEVMVQQAILDVARPKARPRSLSKTVARAKAAATSKQQNVQTASLTPATALNTSKASPPTAVNVQKEATEKSRFNKRRMSLIGVYGTASNRRALVRLPSGRYVKVKRGQNLSGWKVSAIGESSVKITKGNRNQTLRLPK